MTAALPSNRMPLPSVERLRELLHYDPHTGALTWRVKRRGFAAAGTVAGAQKPRGHFEVKVDGIRYQAHRVAWKLYRGKEPPEFLDHWDRDPSNNRIGNLREADASQNCANTSRQKRNISGFLGVSPRYYGSQKRQQREKVTENRQIKSWRAQISHNGHVIYLGEYSTPEQAHATYLYHAMIYHGFFASDGEQHGEGGRFGFIQFMLAHLMGPQKGEEKHE